MKVLAAFFSNVFFNFVIGLMVASFLGPEEFGRFALALAIGLATQTIVFDWLRLGAIRFYSERSAAEQPELRATLDLAFGVLIVWLAIAAAIVLSLAKTPLSSDLLGLAMGTVVANAMFDYSTALARARFRDGLYARLVVIKNLLALALIGGAAWWFRSAQMALFGGILSLGGSVRGAQRPGRERGRGGARAGAPDRRLQRADRRREFSLSADSARQPLAGDAGLRFRGDRPVLAGL